MPSDDDEKGTCLRIMLYFIMKKFSSNYITFRKATTMMMMMRVDVDGLNEKLWGENLIERDSLEKIKDKYKLEIK
jgi:hypothetical protein